MATEGKKPFLAVSCEAQKCVGGAVVGSSLLGLAKQDGQASVRNDPCILSCLVARYELASLSCIFNGSLHTQAV